MNDFGIEDLNRLLASESTGGAEELNESSLGEEFADLGYDSLALLELVSKVEREYGLKLPDNALENMLTPKSAVYYIGEKLSEKKVQT